MMALELKVVRGMLPAWKQAERRLAHLLDRVNTEAQFQQWLSAQKAHDDNLRRAFYEDTKDRNTLENCMLASPEWIIKMAEGEKKS